MISYASAQRVALAEVVVRKTRRLPCDGEVLVKSGDRVRSADVVARAKQPAPPLVVPVGRALGVPTKDVTRLLRRWAGEPVTKDEIIAQRRGSLGLGKRVCRSPITGTVVSGPHSTGEVIIAPPDVELALCAGVAGRVVGVVPQRGVIVETVATYVQGAGGFGEAVNGVLHSMGKATAEIKADAIANEHAGAVVFGGFIALAALQRAVEAGVAGVVVGGVSGEAYLWLLSKRPAITLVVTEGAGLVPMAAETFRLLERQEGMAALICGAEEWQSGSEVIVPLQLPAKTALQPDVALAPGVAAFVAGGQHFGQRCRVIAMPSLPQWLPSGISTRVAVVKLDEDLTATVARENLVVTG